MYNALNNVFKLKVKVIAQSIKHNITVATY